MCGGRSSVSSGSANTAFASSAGEKMIFLMCVESSEITLERPTSEPVPAVVGKATNQGSSTLDRPHAWMVPCVFENVARMSRHQRDRLGDVERGAAAEADHCVGAMCLEGGHAVVDLALHRVAPDLRVRRHLEPGKIVDERFQHRQRGDAAVGDDQRSLHTLRDQVLGDELARAGTEVDGRREGEAMNGHDKARMRVTTARSPSARSAAQGRRSATAPRSMSGRITQVSVRR